MTFFSSSYKCYPERVQPFQLQDRPEYFSSIRAQILEWEMNTTSANKTIITQTIIILIRNFIGQVDGLSFSDRGWWCFFASSFLTQSRWLHGPSWDALRHEGVPWAFPASLCSDLWPCLHVSSGENSGDLITKLKWCKNFLKSSLGNALFHIITNENSTCSASSFPIHIAFLQASSHCGRVMPVKDKILAYREAHSLFSRSKWSAEWVWLTFHAQAH